MTLQPAIVNEASQAMKWTKNYDKGAFRAAYLSLFAVLVGRGANGAVGFSSGSFEIGSGVSSGSSIKEVPTKPVNVATPEEEKPITKPAVVEQPTERRESMDEMDISLESPFFTGGCCCSGFFLALNMLLKAELPV
jgi:hypothetical protein